MLFRSIKAYSVQKRFAPLLKSFLADIPIALDWLRLDSEGDGLPPPPKRPVAVAKVLGQYAIALFDVEASFYPQGERLPAWLQGLALKVERDVLVHAMKIGRPTGIGAAIVAGPSQGLAYHISETEMRDAIKAALKFRLEGPHKSTAIPLPSPAVARILRIEVSMPV